MSSNTLFKEKSAAPKTYTLRRYQKESVEAALEYIHSDSTKPSMIVAPVGSGKSLIIADVADKVDDTVIVLQPNKELLEQNYNKYLSYGNKASIYSASFDRKELGHVTFATIGSIRKEAPNLKEKGVGMVIIDECHYQSKKKGMIFKFLQDVGITKVVGLTATPLEMRSYGGESSLAMINRSNKNLFKDIIKVVQVSDVSDKYWAPLIYEKVEVDQTPLRLNTTGSDYTDHSLKEYYEQNNLRNRIYEEVHKQLETRKSILVFVSSIAEAEILSNIIGEKASVVHSKMRKKERQQVVEGFKALEIPVVINVNVLSVGFDHPELDCIISARPTNSFVILYQQYGRGVRQHPDKENCLIIDMAGNLGRFAPIEDIEFKKGYNTNGWGMFAGGKQLTLHKVSFQRKSKKAKKGIFTFGKFNGWSVKDVEDWYLKWMLTHFVGYSEDKRKLQQQVAKEMIKRGYYFDTPEGRISPDEVEYEDNHITIGDRLSKKTISKKDIELLKETK